MFYFLLILREIKTLFSASESLVSPGSVPLCPWGKTAQAPRLLGSLRQTCGLSEPGSRAGGWGMGPAGPMGGPVL